MNWTGLIRKDPTLYQVKTLPTKPNLDKTPPKNLQILATKGQKIQKIPYVKMQFQTVNPSFCTKDLCHKRKWRVDEFQMTNSDRIWLDIELSVPTETLILELCPSIPTSTKSTSKISRINLWLSEELQVSKWLWVGQIQIGIYTHVPHLTCWP